jgi:hypothetical protein
MVAAGLKKGVGLAGPRKGRGDTGGADRLDLLEREGLFEARIEQFDFENTGGVQSAARLPISSSDLSSWLIPRRAHCRFA